jgi:hypothetical protein
LAQLRCGFGLFQVVKLKPLIFRQKVGHLRA